jgi:hypothetical protein
MSALTRDAHALPQQQWRASKALAGSPAPAGVHVGADLAVVVEDAMHVSEEVALAADP